MTEFVIKIRQHKNLTDQECEQFLNLWYTCFRRKVGVQFYEKYQINDSLGAFAYVDGELVACYNVLLFEIKGLRLALSVDTMSNGKLNRATTKLAERLYAKLKADGIAAVVGFPNKNVINIRKKYLNWRIISEVKLRLIFRAKKKSEEYVLYGINRPRNFCFNSSRLKGRLAGFSSFGRAIHNGIIPVYIEFSARNYKGITIPKWIIQPKYFGLVWLVENGKTSELEDMLVKNINWFFIDVP